MRKYQATLTSFIAFSKAVLIGLETSSAALEATAWKSFACSTVISTLLAQECGLQFDDFRQRLGADQSFEMREAGFGIGAQSGNRLERQVVGNGLGGLEGGLESLLGLFGAGLQLGIGLFRLLDALFGESADLVGGLGSVEAREFDVLDSISGLARSWTFSILFRWTAASKESRLVHV